MSAEPGTCRSRSRTIVKFGLLYFVALSLTVLIFTAVNKENVSAEQAYWWWGLVLSLFFTCSTALTALVLAISVEHYHIPDNDEPTTPGGIPVSSAVDTVALAPDPDPGNSSSFKTVLTINSAVPTVSKKDTINANNDEPTETKRHSPVTVVDMHKNHPRRDEATSTWMRKSPNVVHEERKSGNKGKHSGKKKRK